MANCFSCLRGFHKTCRPPCECDHDLKDKVVVITKSESVHEVSEGSDEIQEQSNNGNGAGEERTTTGTHRFKRDQSLKDQQSTGRKRAARAYPLDRSAPCEWQGLELVGGGITPILGCGIIKDGVITAAPGLQQNRHHGPDKNTLNNEPGNVHRICARCHNEWHAKNDTDYDSYKKLRAD